MERVLNMTDVIPAKILGVQFSIMSPDEIRRASVAEITSRDTYENNKPKIGGLFDPRMGVLEPGLICPTDGLDYIHTPGYFGHIELAKPVFYIQYINTVLKILRCVCFKCSKLLINKERHNYLIKLNNEERWSQLFALISKNKKKKCGDEFKGGCGCSQPSKYRKDGFATIYAEWDALDDEESISIKVTPELALKILRRISNVDVDFMGFSSTWSRPDWMICQVLAIPPPAVRPSVKHDAQQRSEDDITHIICNIIKTNKVLEEKLKAGDTKENIIDDWTQLLQYYIATQVDNKIPGVAAVAQRSGRPLKSIKERLNGKTGRVRGNLMGKRVDFSARSVITADPNISIRELGVPEKIAKNITKPVVVNNNNKNFLMKLIENGPNQWPGAKILEKKNGECISLRWANVKMIKLENGDLVHRHMMDGDAILFNRQPTLHRMSMMCHRVKVMKHGDTFRMNVADTKPYNADFDGDEMNLHMPQDVESESELLNLAAVPHQLVSPANNATIVGIFQDSLLGAYQLTRDNINFTKRSAMNLLMNYDHVNINVFQTANELITSHEILSQIMPKMTLKRGTMVPDENGEDKYKPIIDLENGVLKAGQFDKKVLGSGSNGMLHRVCNDFGNMRCSDFIDDLQNIVTDYMKQSSYSVGISDLISNQETKDKIVDIITDKKVAVNNIIDKIHLGVFENDTGKTNLQEFEMQVNNILNEASSQAGKVGRKSLASDNRFVTMVNAGSKGSELNISFMISCLGQQNVNGKRIPYGFENRTLPHFTKYDDTLSSRGFVESSYIGGLTPSELFFHAMGGRVGLIDTAVKTSQTGYIQRRLIKGMEDLKVEYDMTVRNNKGKIVQYSYGDDGMDTVKVEGQSLPLSEMSRDDIYSHFHIPEESNKVLIKAFTKDVKRRMKLQKDECRAFILKYADEIIMYQKDLVDKVFHFQNETRVYSVVPFQHIINNIQHQCNLTHNSLVDISPVELFHLLDEAMNKLNKIHYCKPNKMFIALFKYYLSPKSLLVVKRFNRSAIVFLLETIILQYKKGIVAPGEMVGMIAAQSIGEPTTQMTLNTFHFAGVASKSNVTRGVPRIEEILSLTENIKNPSLTIALRKDERCDRKKAESVMYMIENTKLRNIVDNIQLCFEPITKPTSIEADSELLDNFDAFEQMVDSCDGVTNLNNETKSNAKSKWIIRMALSPEVMLEKNITMDDVYYTLNNVYKNEIECIFNDFNDNQLVFRIRIKTGGKKKSNELLPLDQSDEIYLLKQFQDNLLDNIILRGVKDIRKVILRKVQVIEDVDGSYTNKENWVLDTDGCNLSEVLALDFIEPKDTVSNNIIEMYDVLGIEAARQCIYNELTDVIEFDGTYVNAHHLNLLCDRMSYNTKMTSIFRHGINNDNIGPLAKASFEETPEMFFRAAKHGEMDIMRGVSSNIMCGQEGNFGTSAFSTLLDMEQFMQQPVPEPQEDDEPEWGTFNDEGDCTLSNIQIDNQIQHVKKVDYGDDDDDYMPTL
jgi:DNA-directed RNA polymerase II subunit RPB1|uniref:DNA-directed RNA polymerase II subunit RPB1 n=1 Tax=viral metagenome TaxID=1070528 RepID=A0A6C0JAR5_9ZZZZ